MKTDTCNPSISMENFDRAALLKTNCNLISQLEARLKSKRWRSGENEGLKVSYIRALIASLTCANQILKDIELDEFKKRLEALENSQNKGNDKVYTPVFEVDECEPLED